jgi:hypothetical protein
VTSFATVAVNCWVVFTGTFVETGDTEMERLRRVIPAWPVALLLVTEIAWRITELESGEPNGPAGAV